CLPPQKNYEEETSWEKVPDHLVLSGLIAIPISNITGRDCNQKVTQSFMSMLEQGLSSLHLSLQSGLTGKNLFYSMLGAIKARW
ncbi:MAG: hypothetical protein JZU65_12845, partial [Chlorobium sp.]|nr:hypothetical protein [Chlorobium sp.]